MILYQGIWQEKDKAGEEEPSPSYTCEWLLMDDVAQLWQGDLVSSFSPLDHKLTQPQP